MLSACPKNRAGCSHFRRLFRWQMPEHGPPVRLVTADVSRLCFNWDFHVLRFCLDPQPSTPRSRFIGVNSQPSPHQVANVTNDVPKGDRWIPCVLHNGYGLVSLKKPYHSREETGCGLDVEPEVGFRNGSNKKKHEKTTNYNIHDQFGCRNERQRDDLFGQ